MHFGRFATLLSYHMEELQRVHKDTRTALAESMAARAASADAAALAAPPPPSSTVANPRGSTCPNGRPSGSHPILVRITSRRPTRPAELSTEEPPSQRSYVSVAVPSPEESDPEEPEEGEYSPEPTTPGRN